MHQWLRIGMSIACGWPFLVVLIALGALVVSRYLKVQMIRRSRFKPHRRHNDKASTAESPKTVATNPPAERDSPPSTPKISATAGTPTKSGSGLPAALNLLRDGKVSHLRLQLPLVDQPYELSFWPTALLSPGEPQVQPPQVQIISKGAIGPNLEVIGDETFAKWNASLMGKCWTMAPSLRPATTTTTIAAPTPNSSETGGITHTWQWVRLVVEHKIVQTTVKFSPPLDLPATPPTGSTLLGRLGLLDHRDQLHSFPILFRQGPLVTIQGDLSFVLPVSGSERKGTPSSPNGSSSSGAELKRERVPTLFLYPSRVIQVDKDLQSIVTFPQQHTFPTEKKVVISGCVFRGRGCLNIRRGECYRFQDCVLEVPLFCEQEAQVSMQSCVGLALIGITYHAQFHAKQSCFLNQVLVEAGSKAQFLQSQWKGCGIGLRVTQGSQANIIHSSFSFCHRIALQVQDHSEVNLIGAVRFLHGGVGLQLEDGATVTIQDVWKHHLPLFSGNSIGWASSGLSTLLLRLPDSLPPCCQTSGAGVVVAGGGGKKRDDNQCDWQCRIEEPEPVATIGSNRQLYALPFPAPRFVGDVSSLSSYSSSSAAASLCSSRGTRKELASERCLCSLFGQNGTDLMLLTGGSVALTAPPPQEPQGQPSKEAARTLPSHRLSESGADGALLPLFLTASSSYLLAQSQSCPQIQRMVIRTTWFSMADLQSLSHRPKFVI